MTGGGVGLMLPPMRRAIGDERCDRCKHCAAASNPQAASAGQLECRRFPPGLATAGPGQIVALFPLVDAGSYCGEFQRRVVLDS